jgi:hypothetical protein
MFLFMTEMSQVPFQTWWEQGRAREHSVVKGAKLKKSRVTLPNKQFICFLCYYTCVCGISGHVSTEDISTYWGLEESA